jgi:two-component system, OmpR family, sensor kinase
MSRDFDLGGPNAHVEVSEIPTPVQHDEPWDPNAAELSSSPPTDERAPAGPEPAPPRRTSRRWRFLPRTLAGRLILGVVSLVLVLVLAMGAATYVLLRPFLYGQLDQQLRPLASNNANRLTYCLSNNAPLSNNPTTCRLPNPYGLHSAQPQWIAAYDANGQPLIDSLQGNPDYVLLTLSPSDVDLVISDVGGAHTVASSDGTEVRVIAQTQVSSPGLIVVTGLSTSEVRTTMHRLVVIELGIGLGLLLVAVVATAYGVRLSLRPLRRVTSTAREVTAELSPEGTGLDRRVPVAPSEVDSEAGQMAESVNTLLGAVETQFAARVASEDRMRQFMADASHELRTPLTSIRGYAELARMRRANGTADVDSDADTLNRIESEGTRMSRLVDDLLLLARTDRGAAPQLDEVDTVDLVATAIEGARAAFPQRRIDVAVEPDVPIYGDYDQLLRVLRNLVTNSAVHTTPTGPIRVSAYRDGADSVLQVDDAGPGLPPDEAVQVFDRFWRADKARTRARGGSGLGMSIVRSIVEAHGGTVRFDSSVRAGSTVTVRLPSSPVLSGHPAPAL